MLEKYMRNCSICGNMFYCDCIDLWAYKYAYKKRSTGKLSVNKAKLFCSWHCMREYEKNKPQKRTFNKIAMEDRYGEV